LPLEAFRCGGHVLVAAYCGYCRVVGCNHLALRGNYLQLRVERREERGNEFLETVEHGKGAHKRHGGYGNAHYGYARDDVYGVVPFVGKKVSAGDEKG